MNSLLFSSYNDITRSVDLEQEHGDLQNHHHEPQLVLKTNSYSSPESAANLQPGERRKTSFFQKMRKKWKRNEEKCVGQIQNRERRGDERKNGNATKRNQTSKPTKCEQIKPRNNQNIRNQLKWRLPDIILTFIFSLLPSDLCFFRSLRFFFLYLFSSSSSPSPP